MKKRPCKTSIETPLDVYDSPQVAQPRKRNRHWEKQHQHHKAVYRGVDPKLSLQVKSIANDLNVPAGVVARAVIEHALRCYERGELDLDPRPDPHRLRKTLLATHAPGTTPARGNASKPKPEMLWRVITTWRGFSPELKRELSALASEEGLNVPVGELITVLLGVGLKEVRSNRWTLPALCPGRRQDES